MDKYQEWMEEILVCSYDKFVDITNLVLLVIDQLSENEIRQHMQENNLKRHIKKMQDANQRYWKDNIIQELNIITRRRKPSFLSQVNWNMPSVISLFSRKS